MQMKRESRKVSLKTIFDLLKQKPSHLIFGIIFTLIPLLFGIILSFIFSSIDPQSPEIDFDLIDANGVTIQATVNNIEVQDNISINNEHPRLISYSYNNGDRLIDDKFRALDSVNVYKLSVGDTIQIKYFNEQTIIAGLKPYKFPTKEILLIMISFLVIGLTALGLLYWRVRRQLNLFKNGNVTNAEIISMVPTSGLPISGLGQKVTVHYQYQTIDGQKILGKSVTSDYTILTSKKQGDIIKIFVSPNNETESSVFSRLDEIRNHWKIS
jgi:hypothetical protein